jgi:hypothetical protein
MVHVGCLHPADLSSDDRAVAAPDLKRYQRLELSPSWQNKSTCPEGQVLRRQNLIELLMVGPTNHVFQSGRRDLNPRPSEPHSAQGLTPNDDLSVLRGKPGVGAGVSLPRCRFLPAETGAEMGARPARGSAQRQHVRTLAPHSGCCRSSECGLGPALCNSRNLSVDFSEPSGKNVGHSLPQLLASKVTPWAWGHRIQ